MHALKGLTLLFVTVLTISSTSATRCLLKETEQCKCYDNDNGLAIFCGHFYSINQISNMMEYKDLEIELYISNLNMTRIPAGYFKNTPISMLQLDSSGVEVIETDAFAGSEHILKEFRCFDCPNLRLMPNFTSFTRMEAFYLHSNRTFKGHADCRVLKFLPTTLERLEIGQSGIETVDMDCMSRFVNLKWLLLDFNPLKTFKGRFESKIKILGLAFGDLDYMPIEVMTSLPKGAVVDLRSDKITTLRKEDLIKLVQNDYKVELVDNKIVCDCSTSWFPDFFKEYGHGFLFTYYDLRLPCYGNNSRAGKRIIALKNEDYTNCV